MQKAVFIVCIFNLYLAFTQNLEFGINIPVSEGNVQQKFPDLHIDYENTIHVVWVEQIGNAKNVYYSQSQDFGLNFSEKVRVNTIANHIEAFSGGGPRVRSNGNQVFVIWADSRNGYNNTSIFMTYSLDNGINWLDEFEASDQPHFQLYADMELDETGNGHLVFYNFDASLWFEDVRYSTFNSMDITESMVVGITTETQEPCDCCAPDLEITQDGTIYIAYRNNVDNIRDHYITRKPAGSGVFETAVIITEMNDQIGFCPASSPSIAIGDNWIGAGFMNYSQGSTLLTGGAIETLVFNNPVSVPDLGGVTNYPSVQILSDDIYSIWVDSQSNTIEFTSLNVISIEMANTQSITDQNIDLTSSTEPKLIANEIGLFSVWSDNRTGFPNIYFASTYEIEFMPGDIDGNLLVNVSDLLLVIFNILGIGNLTTVQFLAADMSGDQEINILDIIQIVNLIIL